MLHTATVVCFSINIFQIQRFHHPATTVIVIGILRICIGVFILTCHIQASEMVRSHATSVQYLSQPLAKTVCDSRAVFLSGFNGRIWPGWPPTFAVTRPNPGSLWMAVVAFAPCLLSALLLDFMNIDSFQIQIHLQFFCLPSNSQHCSLRPVPGAHMLWGRQSDRNGCGLQWYHSVPDPIMSAIEI